MGDLSEHFSAAEFACKGPSTDARHTFALHRPHPHLVRLLERIRAERGEPLRVVSGWRCPGHNRRVGGASASQHLYGLAADIPPGWVTPARARVLGAIGVGVSGEWAVHVDVRPGPPASWRY